MSHFSLYHVERVFSIFNEMKLKRASEFWQQNENFKFEMLVF